MAPTWWRDSDAVEKRVRHVLKKRLAGRGEWLHFLERRWRRKWDDFWPDYAEDFDLATDEGEAEAVLDQLVERFVGWVRDYFVDDEDAAEPATPQAQPVRPKPSPALDRHLLLLERTQKLLERDPFVQEARALFDGRLLGPHEAVDVLSSPLLARWDLARWLRSGLPVHHVAEPVIDLATREAYWREHMERSVAAGWSVEEAWEQADRCEVYRVLWPGGERLVDVPKRADVELVWAVPAWRWVQVPFRERASVPPHWQPWARESGGRVVVLVELQVAVAGSPLALIYRAVARVMQTLGCPPGPAVLWLLCGPETFRPAVGWSRTFGSWDHSTSWVELTLLAGLPVDVVIDSYRKAVARAARWAGPATPSPRPVDERTLALAEFWFGWVERGGQQPTYEALRRDWNARYPDWRYERASSFWRALRNSVWAVYRVALPKCLPRS
jgi:hypothetical protein